jgi:hypothetical protein
VDPARRGPAVLTAAIVPVALSAWVYFPITRAYFWADDFVCLASIRNDGFLRFVLRPFGGHNLLLRNLVFYASYGLFGLRADLYFWTVLLTHLVNVFLLFRILRNLTGSLTLACFGATLWGTSPVGYGALGWYAVYGQVLATTLVLVVLAQLTALAADDRELTARRAATWYALLLLATVCFGVGIGVALVFPAVLFLVLPTAWRQPRVRLAYLGLPLVTLAVYLAFRHLYPLLAPLPPEEGAMETAVRDSLPLLPSVIREFVAFSIAATLRSFFFVRRAYPDVASSVAIGAFAVGCLVLLWRGNAEARRAGVSMVVLCGGVYAVIAAGRASFFDARTPLGKTVGQLRYHYLGAIPIVVLACLALREVGRIGPLRAVPRPLLLVAALAIGVYGYPRSTFRIYDNLLCRLYVDATMRGIEAEVAAHPVGATVYLDNGDPPATLLGPVMRKRDFPGRAAVLLLHQPGDEVNDRQVRFVERDPSVLAWYAERPDTPLARLLVPPDAARGKP